MRTQRREPRRSTRYHILGALFAAGLLTASAGVHAQAVVMAGNYQNFDVLNNTGQEACGFEMQVYGVSASQLTRIFPSNWNAGVIRYGFGTATDFPGGTYVRWESSYDPASGQFATCTPVPPTMTTVPGDSCWTLGMPNGAYQASGCEHFGISTTYTVNPTNIVYHWLVPDPNNVGQLMYSNAAVSIPAPVWTVAPPAQPALPPVVVAEVEAPPPKVPAQFGDAQWVKVYKTEQPDPIQNVDDLVGDNHAVVPDDPAEIESPWSLLQADPPNGGNKGQRGKLAHQGNLGNGHHAVVRRYEYYEYAGAYDPITHEALCADLVCNAPSPGELGDAIGAQNVAANVVVNALTLNVSGSGSVASSDNTFACPSKCYGVYNPGSTITLTAKPNSGSALSQWGGACAGNALTCTVTLNAESSVTAAFLPMYTLSVGRSNPGNVIATPAGVDRTLDCGSKCSAKFVQGTIVTLTAIPPDGKTFASWSGACSGTATTCSISISKDTSVQAIFNK